MTKKEFNTGCPVTEGDQIIGKILTVGEKGDGIMRHEGFVIIVPDAQVGQEVQVKITRVMKKFAFAVLEG